jgi:hypothetical protein
MLTYLADGLYMNPQTAKLSAALVVYNAEVRSATGSVVSVLGLAMAVKQSCHYSRFLSYGGSFLVGSPVRLSAEAQSEADCK